MNPVNLSSQIRRQLALYTLVCFTNHHGDWFTFRQYVVNVPEYTRVRTKMVFEPTRYATHRRTEVDIPSTRIRYFSQPAGSECNVPLQLEQHTVRSEAEFRHAAWGVSGQMILH